MCRWPTCPGGTSRARARPTWTAGSRRLRRLGYQGPIGLEYAPLDSDRGRACAASGRPARLVPVVARQSLSEGSTRRCRARRTVAFIGLGIMGRPMAANLVKAGFDVVGYSRRRESADGLLAAGGRWADSVAAAVRDADAVITMLPDSPDVEAVALGPDGVVAARRPARCTST